MKKILSILFIIYSSALIAQVNNKDIDSMRMRLQKTIAGFDSSRKRSDSIFLEQSKYRDSVNMAETMEQNSRNLNSLLNTMKERERKQKKMIWLKIGLGILFLVIGIIGIARKRKNKSKVN